MQCSRIRGMLTNYALGDVRVTEKLCVEVHVSHCRDCREELEDLCEIMHACDRMLAHPAPKDDFDALMARIALEESLHADEPVRVRLRWRGLLFRGVAAAVLLVVALLAAPYVRQTGRAMRDMRETTTVQFEADKPVRVPVVTEPFVKRASDIRTREGVDSLTAGIEAAAIR